MGGRRRGRNVTRSISKDVYHSKVDSPRAMITPRFAITLTFSVSIGDWKGCTDSSCQVDRCSDDNNSNRMLTLINQTFFSTSAISSSTFSLTFFIFETLSVSDTRIFVSQKLSLYYCYPLKLRRGKVGKRKSLWFDLSRFIIYLKIIY